MIYFIVEQAKDFTNGDDGLQDLPNATLPLGTANIDLTTHLPSLGLGPFGNLADLQLLVRPSPGSCCSSCWCCSARSSARSSAKC